MALLAREEGKHKEAGSKAGNMRQTEQIGGGKAAYRRQNRYSELARGQHSYTATPVYA
ncbi:hypothetical protein J27TS7_12450 [Paenibacillus dendritiformis]|nr:hypothetical protein J27TS7_12450 [Paenibacillus dendritiformis]